MGWGVRAGETNEERFWRQVDQSDGCWLWQGSIDASGYGRMCIDYKTYKAHRLSWQFTHGEIPEGMFVCHHCDNPPCVRPGHLFLGDSWSNMADMSSKGRGTVGDKHWTRRFPERVSRGVRPYLVRQGSESGRAKLTEEQVLEMRAAYVPRRVSYTVLAARYGISAQQVKNIIRRKNWTHI